MLQNDIEFNDSTR